MGHTMGISWAYIHIMGISGHYHHNPWAQWCWYIYLQNRVILFGTTLVNMPATWSIWVTIYNDDNSINDDSNDNTENIFNSNHGDSNCDDHYGNPDIPMITSMYRTRRWRKFQS